MADQISLRRETNLYDDETIKAVNNKVTSQYAVSITASATVAKTATVDGTFTLFKNARVSVFFQNANTSTSPTLNVAGTGAKPIWAYGGPLSADGNTFNWVANSTIEFVYDGEHWLVADSGAVGLLSQYDEKLNQEAIFNKLTNNGVARGIFLNSQTNQLYINMDYLQTGTLKLGGANNGNGLQIVYDENGNEIGRWDKDGLSATGDLYLKKTVNNRDYGARLGEVSVDYDGDGIIDTTFYGLSIGGFGDGTLISPASQIIRWTNNYNAASILRYLLVTTQYPYVIMEENFDPLRGYLAWNLSKKTNDSSSWTKMSYFRIGEQSLEYWTKSGYPSAYLIHNSSGGSFNMTLDPYVYCSFDKNSFIVSQSSSAKLQHSSSGLLVNGKWVAYQSSSSKRYKHAVTEKIENALDAHKLYDLPMKQFVFNKDHKPQYADMAGQTIPGFIAEDVAEIYPAAVIHDADGNIESWDERRIIPGMLALIQEQKKQLDEQAERIKKLESNTSFIHMT